MKCPYKEFQDCIVEKCPACNYEVVKMEVVEGRYPNYMSLEEAIRRGNAWKSTRTTYEFISCKLVDGGVQPPPIINQEINNVTETNVIIAKKGVFY